MMLRIIHLAWVAATILACVDIPLEAANCAKCRLQAAWGLAAQPDEIFNPDQVSRFEGEVLSVQEVEAEAGVVEGVYVLLKTSEGNLSVRMGPSWYLKKQGFSVEPYDYIEVLASKVSNGDRDALIATKAKNGSRTIALRNRSGRSVWNNT